MQANDIFLKKTFGRYLVPTMFSVLGGTINVLFDGILVGQKLGDPGLVAVNLCMPVYLLLCTVGALISAGAAILSSEYQGKGNDDQGVKIYRLAVFGMAAVGIVITALGLLLLKPVAGLLSGDSGLESMVEEYAGITIAGALPKLLLYLPFYYLRLDGQNRKGLTVMLTMTGLNIVGDWFFLFVLNLGMRGAAFASVLSTLIACVMGFMFLQRKHSGFRMGRDIAPISILPRLCALGSPAALNNLLSAVRMLALNFILLTFYGSAAVAVFAVVNSLGEFMLCIVNGIPQTAAPMIGIYAAERNNTGNRILVRRQLRIGLILSSIFGLVIVAAAGPISWCFGVTEPLYLPLSCFSVSLVFQMCNSIMASFFNCSGHVGLANLILFFRLVGFALTFACLLQVTGLSVWLFLPLTEVATTIFWVSAARLSAKRNQNISPVLLLNDSWDKQGNVLDFSVRTSPEDICAASEKITEFCENNQFSSKQTMRISLAIEELMIVMTDKCLDNRPDESMDLRVFSMQGSKGIRLRCAGRYYNPIIPQEIEKNREAMLGIAMIMNLAEETLYQRTFGINSILILF